MPTFGSRENNDKTTGGGKQFEMFIKNFQDPLTQIAILDPNPPTKWMKIEQHYDPKAGGRNGMAYPCARFEMSHEDPNHPCVGCDYPVEHPEYKDVDEYFPDAGNFREKKVARRKADPGWAVRDTTPRWIIPAIDPKGYVSLYYVGSGLHTFFKEQYDVLKNLVANEWTIKRNDDTANGFTQYTAVAMPGEPRRPKQGITVPDEGFISGLLGKKYDYALEVYGHSTGDEQATGFAPAPDPAPLAQKAAPTPDEAQATVPATGAPAPVEEAKVETGEATFIPREASTGEIKDWLESAKVDFPPKAARQVLIGLAERKLTELQGDPPF